MSLLDNLQLKHKLFLPIGMAVAGLVIVGMTSYQAIQTLRINGEMDHALQLNDDVIAEFATPKLNILQTRILVYQMLFAPDKETKLQLEQQVGEQRRLYEEKQREFASKLPEGTLKELITQRARAAAIDYFDFTQQQLIPALLRDNKKESDKLIPLLRAKYEASESTIAEVRKLADQSSQAGKAKADQMVASRTTMLIVIGVVVVVAVGLFGVVLTRSITDGTGRMLNLIQQIAANNLGVDDIDTSSQDEIGQACSALNKMKNSLRELIQSIAGTAEHVASASEELSSSATQQAQGAETQNNQTTQVATAMQEMSSTVLQVSENSNKAAEASRQAAETAREGGQIVEDTLSKMRIIADSVGGTAKKMEELGKSSDQIGRIAGVIDDIADQTNLLALNAAIEAARAGEQGRGFAVVADEVRKLAERTTTATKEIAQMIKNIQDETKTAVTAMEAGTKQVEDGVQSTSRAGDSLKQIIHMSEQVGEMITHIATAATEQSSASEEINNNMEQIAKLVRESADGAQQSAKASQDLSGLALDLQNMVGKFDVGSGHSSMGADHRRRGTPGSYGREREEPAKAFAASAR